MTTVATPRSRGFNNLLIEQNARVVDANNMIERYFLSFLLIMFYVTYGALGRDLFYNHLYDVRGVEADDPIGRYLPYARVATCFISLAFVTLRTDVNWVFSKIPWMLAPFCIFAILTCLWSGDPKAALRNGCMTLAMWFCISPLIHRLGLSDTVRTTLLLLSVVCLLSLFVALFLPHIGRHTGLETSQTSHKGEWRGIFTHKNGLGPWAAWGTAFLLTYARICGGHRLYWWAAWLAAFACLIFAHSATAVAMAALLIALQIFFALLRRFTLSSIILFLAPPTLGFAIFAVINPDMFFELLGRDSSFTGRTEIWAISVEYIWRHPFLGQGFQLQGGEELLTRLFTLLGQPLGPENGFLVMMLDVGIVGLTLFMVPYLLAIRNGFEWLKFTNETDRAGLEMLISILFGTLLASMTTSDVLLSTGYDGVFSFVALFALLTTPRSPPGVMRGEWRLAKYRVPPMRRRARSRTA